MVGRFERLGKDMGFVLLIGFKENETARVKAIEIRRGSSHVSVTTRYDLS